MQEHLRSALALLVAVALSACSSGTPDTSSSPGSSTSGAADTAGTTVAARSDVATDADKTLNVYNWSDYIDPTVIPAFEKEYGIKVNYDVFDSNEVVETKLLSGKTGYDVVVPSASFMQRQIQAGVFQKLDKSLLPNFKNLDPQIDHKIEVMDPGNQYGVNYLWGASVVGYNEDQINAAMPNAPVDSFAMLFDPNVIKNFQNCGVSILDAPDEVVGTVLIYLGRDPNSESPDDLKAAEKVLLSIRPYVRYINSSKYIEDLANGELCVALGWNGDVAQAKLRAKDAGRNVKIRYRIAKEGGLLSFDMMAIPADAPHPKNAHLFINYMLRPDVAAKNASAVHYATPVMPAFRLIDPAVYNDPAVYPNDATKTRLIVNATHSMPYLRELNRTWTRFKTGH
ncbi:MAG TPA: polyamine ABC transporter substrate-binding protein [Steroidobacteraceae bacterium]|jgi:putrescine transport system substrate-binding protein|nr:polyamine ABC transporter substrate-binding protein [Steroidobacteraceae bacterium]